MGFEKRKKSGIYIITGIVIFAILIGMFGFSNNLKKPVKVTINQGMTTKEIAKVLKENKVVSSQLMFLVTVNLSEYKGRLSFGEFTFTPEDDYRDVIKKLSTEGAKKETVTITIPEGYSTAQIVKLLAEAGFGSGSEEEIRIAMNAEYDYEFLKKISLTPETRYKLEGFLFPETYEFFTDQTPYEVIDKMLGTFEKEYSKLGVGYDNVYEIITKASVIEKEAKVPSDRAKISGVISNRINKNMPLQIDATVIYAKTKGRYDLMDKVLYKDLETVSLYNTYKNKGLPPGPISNPGIESIKAAVNPEIHNYLYYRIDTEKNDGSHIFSETFDEHRENAG